MQQELIKIIKKIIYNFSFVKLRKYDALKNDLVLQIEECNRKAERETKNKKELEKLKEQLIIQENCSINQKTELIKNKKEIKKLEKEKLEIKKRYKKICSKVGGLKTKISYLEKKLKKSVDELSIAKKELRTRPRTNLQSLVNYHERKK